MSCTLAGSHRGKTHSSTKLKYGISTSIMLVAAFPKTNTWKQQITYWYKQNSHSKASIHNHISK